MYAMLQLGLMLGKQSGICKGSEELEVFGPTQNNTLKNIGSLT